MPTKRHGRVRNLIKRGQAKVVRRTPFTIQLTYDTQDRTQPITLGIDAGSKTVGIVAASDKAELFAAELKPRNDVVKLLADRRAYRRARRNRTTRYRAPRFNNRVRSKHKGWLAPSVEVKIHNHIQGVALAMKLLPITEVIVETAEFDTQRLKALEEGRPIPVGTDYQLGEQYDFYNVRQYVFHRDGYKCRVCGAKHGQKVNGVETKFHVHHLETRKTGGNAPGNLITLCTSCHKKYHDGAQPLPDTIRKPRPMRDAAFMGIMRKTLMARLNTLYPNVPISETHGYITKYTRETNRLPKSHINDALCIAGKPTVKRIDDSFLCVPKRTHNRSLHMDTINRGGYRRARQAPKYVHGFRLFDRVKLPDGREGFVFNRESDGRLRVHTLLNAEPTERIKHYKLKRLMNDGALLIEKRSTRI